MGEHRRLRGGPRRALVRSGIAALVICAGLVSSAGPAAATDPSITPGDPVCVDDQILIPLTIDVSIGSFTGLATLEVTANGVPITWAARTFARGHLPLTVEGTYVAPASTTQVAFEAKVVTPIPGGGTATKTMSVVVDVPLIEQERCVTSASDVERSDTSVGAVRTPTGLDIVVEGCLPATTVTLYADGEPLGTYPVAPDGTWSGTVDLPVGVDPDTVTADCATPVTTTVVHPASGEVAGDSVMGASVTRPHGGPPPAAGAATLPRTGTSSTLVLLRVALSLVAVGGLAVFGARRARRGEAFRPF